MDNFKAVYKILSQLEKDMDKDAVDLGKIDANALCVSEARWRKYIEMMADVGYVKGVRIVEYVDGDGAYDCRNMRITLKGLEYLQENHIMRRIYRTAVGLKEIVPEQILGN